MYSLKDDIEAMFLNSPDKIRAKKKLNELFDKYGESKRAIENGTDGAEHFEYILASAFADEVLAERRQARGGLQERSDMLSYSRQQDMEEPSYSDLEEEEEEELSLTEQVKKVTEDKELQSRTGQMAVEAYKNLDKEKIREDTEKYVKQTLEELRDIKRKRAGYSFDKIYYTQVIDGKEEKGTNENEGGYSDNQYDLGGKTNYGVTQGSLDEYKNWHSSLKTEYNLPQSVKNLSHKQAKNILDEMYYKRYRINYIPNLLLARTTFDHCVNGGPKMNRNLYLAVNEIFNTNFEPSDTISNNLVDKISTLSQAEALSVRDKMVEKKMDFHFGKIDKRHDQINQLNGWYERAKSQYSDKDKFEKMYNGRWCEYVEKYFTYIDEKYKSSYSRNLLRRRK